MHTATERAISLSNVSRRRPTARTGAIDYFGGSPGSRVGALELKGIATGNIKGSADECYVEPRAVRVLCRLVARRAISRATSCSPARPRRRPVPEWAAVTPQTSFARPLPFPDHDLHRCSCHPRLAVVRRRSPRDDGEVVSAAWLVGATSQTGC